MDNNYSHTKKKKLAEKIMNIKDKKQLLKIKTIIFNENPSLSVVKNSTGILLYFQDLKISTYVKLDDFLNNKIIKKYMKKINNINNIENELSCDQNTASSDIVSSLSSNTNDYKYSNKERNIIRRKQYEETLNNLNTNSKIQNDQIDIFIKKS